MMDLTPASLGPWGSSWRLQMNADTLDVRTMPEPSILTILCVLKRAPQMYLAGDVTSRRGQLRALEGVLVGYALALRQHGVGNNDLAMLGRLEDFLRERTQAAGGAGIEQLLAESPSDEDAWNRFWTLVEEFRLLVGHDA